MVERFKRKSLVQKYYKVGIPNGTVYDQKWLVKLNGSFAPNSVPDRPFELCAKILMKLTLDLQSLMLNMQVCGLYWLFV